MNRLEETLKLFNLKINEEFELKEYPGSTCKFNSNGIMLRLKNNGWETCSSNSLLDFITGKITVIKKSWKPNFNDEFFYVGFSSLDLNSKNDDPDFIIGVSTWYNDEIDIARYAIGNCFQTREDARSNAIKVIATYKEKLVSLFNK